MEKPLSKRIQTSEILNTLERSPFEGGHAALLDDFSPELRARMQGKACFNFKTPDPALFTELAKLTKVGFAAYQRWLKQEGYC